MGQRHESISVTFISIRWQIMNLLTRCNEYFTLDCGSPTSIRCGRPRIHTCYRKAVFFILYRIDMEVIPMHFLCFSNENYTKFHVNRTMFNEILEINLLWRFLNYDPICVVFGPFSSGKHKETIHTTFAKIRWKM